MYLTLIWGVGLLTLFIYEIQPCIEYCGVQTTIKSNKAAGRIINAEPSEEYYPWMVLIQKRGKYEERFDTENEKFGKSDSTGTILTKSTVITCGHCICENEEPSATQKYSITCPKTPKEKDDNLNKKEINEIYITVGKHKVDRSKINGKFDDNLKVYFYNYEKYDQQPKVVSKNGDIAIVINKIGLGDWSKWVSNICPPTPQSNLNIPM